MSGGRGARAGRWIILVLLGLYFALPLVAMAEFSTRGTGGHRSLHAWASIGSDPDLIASIVASLELAALTAILMLVLLLPTMTWVQLRLPHLRRTIEFVCLLPLTIPAIVIVVGIAPIYAWVTYLFGESPLTLTFVYVILVLPYAYRALDAGLRGMDLHTLSEAALSLGASWWTVIWRIVVPNVRGAILSAALISVAMVLGEFTIASLLDFQTIQVEINLLGKRNADISIAVSLAALVFAFVLLFALALADRRRREAVDD